MSLNKQKMKSFSKSGVIIFILTALQVNFLFDLVPVFFHKPEFHCSLSCMNERLHNFTAHSHLGNERWLQSV